MRNLKLYIIENEYINYLRKFDNKVAYNKNKKRPFIGVVYENHNHKYFAPLSSPKLKHQKLNPKALDIFKIKNGELGIININNMIPVPDFVLIELLPIINDNKYKQLLINQLTYINNHKRKLLKKVERYFSLYLKGNLSINQFSRCCDFLLLEKKCGQYANKIKQSV